MEFKDIQFVPKPEDGEKSHELSKEASLNRPVVESFLDPDRVGEVWPENISTNEEFLEQIKKRKELNDNLNDVVSRLPRPDTTLEAAINQGIITEDQVRKLYSSLSELLESDQNCQRIIFYLPFEFLPNKNWHPKNDALQQELERFRQTYMEAWKSLLSTHDVRANFVDGDVLEVEKRVGDLPRVVKSAHLIPKMVENGLMDVKDVITLMKESDDQILKDSIADTLPVLADLGYFSEKEINLMAKSKDQLVANMARIISSSARIRERPAETQSETLTLSSVQMKLQEEFSQIDAEDFGDVTEKRKRWLKQEKKREAIEFLGEKIGTAILAGDFTDTEAASFLTAETNITSQQALAEGIRKAVEIIATTDIKKAQTLYAHYKKTLLAFRENNVSETDETLSKTFRRLHHLGIVDDKQLSDLNIVIPKLAGPFSENIKLMENEIQEIQKMVATIESKPELSQLIYPAVLVFGSRLKGYGEQNADIDLGVFVRPGVSIDDRKDLQRLLKEIFSHEKIRGEIVEFWLEEKDDQLNIRDFTERDVLLGESYWTHILFGAEWEGNKNTIRELREKLLALYLYDTDKVIHGRDARSLYLEEMERDTLQYRLMHKGYERFFPPCGGIHTPHADEIDGESMFWDSGYRQMATKLFASRVFLPKISR